MLIIYIIGCVVALMAVCFYEYRDYKRNSNYTYNLCDLLMELTLVITSWIGVVAVIVFVSPGIVMFRNKYLQMQCAKVTRMSNYIWCY